MDRWSWKWVGGGSESLSAPNREAAWAAAVALGLRLSTRGTVLVPDYPTLQRCK